jgi:hypothetical protein
MESQAIEALLVDENVRSIEIEVNWFSRADQATAWLTRNMT